jgi:L-fucose isomerase-like protein
MANKRKMTMGVIVGNRGFFPAHLAKTGREEMTRVLQQAGIDVVVLGPEQSKHGAVESYEEAKRCAELFKSKGDAIDGVIATLPNFGDERAIADTLRLARLNVPVLVQATPDMQSKMTIADRRDSFCGKMSACNNLTQYGIPYSLTTLHTETPDSACREACIRSALALRPAFRRWETFSTPLPFGLEPIRDAEPSAGEVSAGADRSSAHDLG